MSISFSSHSGDMFSRESIGVSIGPGAMQLDQDVRRQLAGERTGHADNPCLGSTIGAEIARPR